MENVPTAPGDAPAAPQSEATPTTNPTPAPAPTPTPAPAPDMHGFTSEQLAEMRKFYDANGGFDRVKSRISNPQPAPQVPEAQPQIPTSQQQYQPQQPMYQPPQGSITPQEFLAQQYFQGLSRDPKYEGISDQIASGNVLKEMASFNIQPLNRDGSINDQMVRRYLDLKAQTVPAKPTNSEPNASNAPTVSYTEVGDNITDINQAYKVLMEPGNPGAQKAEEYIREHLNGKQPNK